MIGLINDGRRVNKSPMLLEDPEKGYLKKMLTTPPVKRIDLHFPLGLEVTARNMKGVTIKDALDAIYKQYRKKVSMLDFRSLMLLLSQPRSQTTWSCCMFPILMFVVITGRR